MGLIFVVIVLFNNAERSCFFEGICAQMSVDKNHASPIDLLLSPVDFPGKLAGNLIPGNVKKIVDDTFDALDTGEVVFSIQADSISYEVTHRIYWFGSEKNAECRYYRLFTASDLILLPDEWFENHIGPMTNDNWRNCRKVISEGTTSLECTWIGLFGEYVTSLTSMIEPYGLSVGEFDLLASKAEELLIIVMDDK